MVEIDAATTTVEFEWISADVRSPSVSRLPRPGMVFQAARWVLDPDERARTLLPEPIFDSVPLQIHREPVVDTINFTVTGWRLCS